MVGIISVLKTKMFDRIDKMLFLLFSSHETEVHLSVGKVSDNLLY